MNAELEAIVAADEEARARVAFAEDRQQRAIEEARTERDRQITARRDAVQAELDAQLQAIRDAGERDLAEARAAHEQYRAALRAVGERELERAARLWARIIRSGGAA